MKHIGDITKINGKLIDPVDVITGGSPCQDLSVAGLRKGLAGERSGLFMEQIRIIKEMREATNGKQPRFMVWENVPGAFSSNKGEDFRAVLEETARIADQDAVIPRPEKEKWTPAGCIMADGWSIAWRVHDAQFWGVPQRRKRIALVADFGGECAPEILFERKGMSGNSETSGKEGKGTAKDTENSIREAGKCLNSWDIQSKHIYSEDGVAGSLYSAECRYGGGEAYVLQNEVYSINPRPISLVTTKECAATLGADDYKQPQAVAYETVVLEGNGSRPSHKGDGFAESEICYTLNSTERHAVAYNDAMITSPTNASNPHIGDPCHTLTNDSRNYVVCLENLEPICIGNGCVNQSISDTTCNTLTSHDAKGGQIVICAAVDCRNFTENSETNGTLQSKKQGYNFNTNNVCRIGSIVRRLTPLECERLQGFPDGWTNIGDWVDSNGKKHKGDADSPRYKALGNSIALPFWKWMACRMIRYDIHTMGSLFDGIGGFPLAFSECGVEPVWASEIEEFCIAVTNKRFNEV